VLELIANPPGTRLTTAPTAASDGFATGSRRVPEGFEERFSRLSMLIWDEVGKRGFDR
jgi:hypothetical protein